MTWLVLGAALGTLLGFVFAALESAVARAGAHHVEELQADKPQRAASIAAVLADRSAVAMVLAFLRVLAESTAAVLVTIAVNDLVHSLVPTLLISTGIMLVVSFLLVGVSPRTLGRQHAVPVLAVAARPVLALRRILAPLVRLLVLLGNAVTPGRGYRDGPFETEADLRELVDIAQASALIEDDEHRMLHSVFDLGDTIAREVMVPRTDMVSIDQDKTPQQALRLFVRSGFSRVPVVDGGPDEVIGLLYFKDVARRVLLEPAGDAGADEPVGLIDLMRPAAFVPESKPADDLLHEMQRDRVHVAVVVDEYGGTAGLVTMEDLLEEIVGEIDDEYDRVTPGVETLGDGRWRVPARMSVDDLADEVGLPVEDDDVETVGGLLAKAIGRVPIPGASAELAGLRFTADRMAGRRHQLATVLVERTTPTADDDRARVRHDEGSDTALEEHA